VPAKLVDVDELNESDLATIIGQAADDRAPAVPKRALCASHLFVCNHSCKDKRCP
jgi:hypothetical protein